MQFWVMSIDRVKLALAFKLVGFTPYLKVYQYVLTKSNHQLL